MLYHICPLLFYLYVFHYSFATDIKFKIKEEEKINSIVGNLNSHLGYDTNTEEGVILITEEKGERFFKIDPNGNLIVKQIIDRDTLCPSSNSLHSTPYGMSQIMETKICSIKIRIKFKNAIITVEVEIEDINDNKPQWDRSVIQLKFTDGNSKGSKVAIPQATDKDVGQNGKISYTILHRQKLPFRIQDRDGLYLEASSVLDREERERYEFTLVAKDHGNVPLSATVKVVVTIEDINDNSPIFSRQTYRFNSIKEDSKIGTVIGQLKASDKDSGLNGEFDFRFASNVHPLVRRYFAVSRDGRVSVKSKLDVDHSPNLSFKFGVTVEDKAVHPYTKSSDATVIIDIIDVNDEKPTMNAIFSDINRINQPQIKENIPLNSLIGVLEVSDLDFKGKDLLYCKSENSYFTLVQENQNYKYNILTLKTFDREKQQMVKLILSCSDGSGNKQTLNRSIIITDVNDNPPIFNPSFYTAKVEENQPAGTEVPVNIKVTDEDSDSVIKYSIIREYTDNFTIDPDTGIIKTRKIFDREECDSYKIKIKATDSIDGPIINTGIATVQIHIEDQNDNRPVFDRQMYTFEVPEGRPGGGYHKVGEVKAVDRDLNGNGGLTYRLKNSPDASYFRIDQKLGKITAVKPLDREVKDKFEFVVLAIDQKKYRRYTAKSDVTVIIKDINDNSPRFIEPKVVSSTFRLQARHTSSHKITQVRAIDDDIGENAKIHYNITAGDPKRIFSIDPNNGLLYLSQSLNLARSQRRQTYGLTITACDNGSPRRRCTNFQNLRIVVHQNDDSSLGADPDGYLRGPNFGKDDGNMDSSSSSVTQHHEAIVICLAALFVILLVTASVLLCLVKCRSHHNHHGNHNSTSSSCWNKRSSRSNQTEKDKYGHMGENSQVATINAKVIDSTRTLYSEKQMWSQSHLDLNPRYGQAIDHTNPNRIDYTIGDALCLSQPGPVGTTRPRLASATDQTILPQFIDPCSGRYHTITKASGPFCSYNDLQMLNNFRSGENVLEDIQNRGSLSTSATQQPLLKDINIYQSIEEANLQCNNNNNNSNNINNNIATSTNNNNNSSSSIQNSFNFYATTSADSITNNNLTKSTINTNNNNSNNNNNSSTFPLNNEYDKNNPKYSTYMLNEASFV